MSSPVLFCEVESDFLIEVPGGMESLKGPEVYPVIALVGAKADSGTDKPIADASSTQGIRHDEPPKMRAFTLGMDPIDRNGSFDAAMC